MGVTISNASFIIILNLVTDRSNANLMLKSEGIDCILNPNGKSRLLSVAGSQRQEICTLVTRYLQA